MADLVASCVLTPTGLVLPAPPTDAERVLYVDARNRLLCFTQLVAWIGGCASLWLFAWHDPAVLWPFIGWVAVGVSYFGLSFTANTTFRRFDLGGHDRAVARVRDRGDYPSIDVFLPNCGEALAVLENTFRHVAALSYPGELRVWCLDDAGRVEVADLATRWGFEYLSRPDKGWFKKAGNLRYAYERTDGDFIVVFDADFCPRPDFLAELVPYALADRSVGIVQSPQYFVIDAGQNWLANGAGSVQEYFYRWVMPGRNARRSPICVGTNALYRRSALQSTGGGALVPNSEDVHTGFNLMCQGYRTLYVPLILAKGLCPDTLAGFFNQQHRWCSGSMSLLFSHKFWHAPIGVRSRLTFLAGMAYYLYTGVAALIAPLPAVVMVWAYPARVQWVNYLLLAPALLQNYVLLPRWHHAPYGVDALRVKVIYTWAHLFAFYDRLTNRALAWHPTGQGTSRPQSRVRLAMRLIIVWPALVGAAVVAGASMHMSGLFDTRFWPLLALTVAFVAIHVTTLAPLHQPVRPITAIQTTTDKQTPDAARRPPRALPTVGARTRYDNLPPAPDHPSDATTQTPTLDRI